ncbi:hypothetical protein AB1Y20_020454 [Prymnesium parvum]|uniref:Vesicle transport v-SNARE N-terminal domain-containing protein n=1 Tax=Prymnesium parvum TaxID=97485 RepID=A0AB34JUM3_PRYPA
MALDEYEEEYRAHIAAANEKVEQAEAGKTPEERRAATTSAERAVEAAKDVVQLMELEGRSLPATSRTRLQAQLRAFRSEVNDLKALIRELRSTKQPSSDCIREELFASHGGCSQGEASERARMLQTNERLASGTERLKDVSAVTMDMENTANSILGDLASQRETLLRARGTLRFASDGLDRSDKILRSMARRAMTNKLVLWVVIGMIVLLIVMVLRSGNAPTDATPAVLKQGGDADWKRTTSD